MTRKNRTFVYWVAKCLDDNRAYNIREACKREAVEKRKAAVEAGLRYGPVTKIVVSYSDRMDFVQQLLGEGGAETLLPEE